MKKLEAIIRPHLLEAAKAALHEAGVTGITVSPVRGFGRPVGPAEPGLGRDGGMEGRPKVKLELTLPDSRVEAIVDCILQVARTERAGDGKILISRVEGAVRVRTGERGDAAL